MAVGRIEVDVVARMDKFEAELSKIAGTLAKTGKTIDSTLATPSAKMALNMGKVFAAMGAVEVAAKGASVGLSLMEALSAESEGNSAEAARHFESMAETIKQLPMGIGPVASAIENLLHQVLEVDDAMRKLAKAEERAMSRELVMAQKDAIDSRMESLAAEFKILNETDDEKRSILEHERDHNKLRADAKKLEKDIKAMDIDPRFKDTLLNKLAIEHGMQQDILNLKRSQKLEAEKEREQNEKALKVQEDALRVDQSRLGKIKQRLGLGAFGTMGEKSGFTQTGDTALGSFTFADQNVGSKIDVLQQEQRDIQRSIDNRTGVIQTLLEKLNAKMGFS